jgi:hypothetical protein
MRLVKTMIAATVLAAAATGPAVMITAAAPAASAAPTLQCVATANGFTCSYASVSVSSSGPSTTVSSTSQSCVNGQCTTVTESSAPHSAR